MVCSPVDTDAMRDVTIPKSFPNARMTLLRGIVASSLIFAGSVAWLIYGLLAHWATGGSVLLGVVVVVLGGGVVARIWIFMRLRAQYVSTESAERDNQRQPFEGSLSGPNSAIQSSPSRQASAQQQARH